MINARITPCDEAGRQRAALLFVNTTEPLLASALDGTMGNVWVDDLQSPTCALAMSNGDFVCFAGDSMAEGASALLDALAHRCKGRTMILSFQEAGWERLIREKFLKSVTETQRYAMREPMGGFSRELLQRTLQALPASFALVAIDSRRYQQVRSIDWARDFCSQFNTYDAFAISGLGYLAISGDEPVSGASSYVVCNGGIEIQVDTREDHRRQGLAAACCAQLILSCMERGISPHWDAANEPSLALALSLGYVLERKYFVLEVDL